MQDWYLPCKLCFSATIFKNKILLCEEKRATQFIFLFLEPYRHVRLNFLDKVNNFLSLQTLYVHSAGEGYKGGTKEFPDPPNL